MVRSSGADCVANTCKPIVLTFAISQGGFKRANSTGRLHLAKSRCSDSPFLGSGLFAGIISASTVSSNTRQSRGRSQLSSNSLVSFPAGERRANRNFSKTMFLGLCPFCAEKLHSIHSTRRRPNNGSHWPASLVVTVLHPARND